MEKKVTEVTPGTVSKILWHFTGGPKWNRAKRRQGTRRKSASQAYKNLVSILRSGELRLGEYREIVNVMIPEQWRYDPKTGEIDPHASAPVTVESSPVCCLADIPIPHLSYHASRYGRFAIGFYRHAAVSHGFNPVLYTPATSQTIMSIYDGFMWLRVVEPLTIDSDLIRVREHLRNCDLRETADVSDAVALLGGILPEAHAVRRGVRAALESFGDFLAMVKTFNPDEFGSVYCEREWRSTRAFTFARKDVAMVVIPRDVRRTEYYERFMRRTVASVKLPRRVPVVPWEDLVET